MNKFVKLATVAALAIGASPANAATVFQSIPDLFASPSTVGWCSDCGYAGEGWRVYDSFSLSADAVISSVTFSIYDGPQFFPTNFNISFFNGATNALGSNFASYDYVPGDYVSVVDSGQYVSLLTVALPGVFLTGGQQYSISFYGDFLAVNGFAGGSGQLLQTYYGTPNFRGDSAGFRLDADGIAAVPEPNTWAMMLVGFGGIGFSMRRRRKTTTHAQLA